MCSEFFALFFALFSVLPIALFLVFFLVLSIALFSVLMVLSFRRLVWLCLARVRQVLAASEQAHEQAVGSECCSPAIQPH